MQGSGRSHRFSELRRGVPRVEWSEVQFCHSGPTTRGSHRPGAPHGLDLGLSRAPAPTGGKPIRGIGGLIYVESDSEARTCAKREAQNRNPGVQESCCCVLATLDQSITWQIPKLQTGNVFPVGCSVVASRPCHGPRDGRRFLQYVGLTLRSNARERCYNSYRVLFFEPSWSQKCFDH